MAGPSNRHMLHSLCSPSTPPGFAKSSHVFQQFISGQQIPGTQEGPSEIPDIPLIHLLPPTHPRPFSCKGQT